MRKRFAGAWAALVLLAANAAAQDGVAPVIPNLLPDPTRPVERPTQLPDYSPSPQSPAQLALSAEYRLFKPRHLDNAFALAGPNGNLVPEGDLVSLPNRSHSGWRFGVAFKPGGSPWEFGVFYSDLKTTDSQTVTAPPGGVLVPLLTRPGGVDTALTATATQRLRYDIWDIELGRNFQMDTSLGLRVLGGVRLANIDQDFAAGYDGMAAAGADVQRHADFQGAGLLIGGEAHWTFGYGLSLFGRARGGLLFGDGTTRVRETNGNGAVVLTSVNDRYTQTVPVVEMGLGAALRFRRLFAAAGYDATNWFDLAAAPTISASGRPMQRQSNLSLDGFFFNFGVAF